MCYVSRTDRLRAQRLRDVLQLHEFIRESSELEDWMSQRRQTAESQDLGNDYQHVQVIGSCSLFTVSLTELLSNHGLSVLDVTAAS